MDAGNTTSLTPFSNEVNAETFSAAPLPHNVSPEGHWEQIVLAIMTFLGTDQEMFLHFEHRSVESGLSDLSDEELWRPFACQVQL